FINPAFLLSCDHLDQPTSDIDFSQLRPPFQAIPVQTNHLTSLYQPCPSQPPSATAVARNCHETGRFQPGPIDPQEGPSKGPASSDQLW
ncbi:hypothetical protein Prudu_004778, partial [Prunus dulcis]